MLKMGLSISLTWSTTSLLPDSFKAITAATKDRLLKYEDTQGLDIEMLSSYFFKHYYSVFSAQMNKADGNESHEDGDMETLKIETTTRTTKENTHRNLIVEKRNSFNGRK